MQLSTAFSQPDWGQHRQTKKYKRGLKLLDIVISIIICDLWRCEPSITKDSKFSKTNNQFKTKQNNAIWVRWGVLRKAWKNRPKRKCRPLKWRSFNLNQTIKPLLVQRKRIKNKEINGTGMQLGVQRRVSQDGIKKPTDVLPYFFTVNTANHGSRKADKLKEIMHVSRLPPRQGWSWWRVEAMCKTRNRLMHRRLLPERSHAQGTNLKLAFSLVTSKRHMNSAGDKARSIIRHTEWYLIKYEKWMCKEKWITKTKGQLEWAKFRSRNVRWYPELTKYTAKQTTGDNYWEQHPVCL